jgi:hypothetical protein
MDFFGLLALGARGRTHGRDARATQELPDSCAVNRFHAQLPHLADKRIADIGGAIGCRENVHAVLAGGCDAKIVEELPQRGTVHHGKGRRHESPLAAKGAQEIVVGKRIGEVAPAAAGGEEFCAGLIELLAYDDLRAGGAGGDGSHHSRGAGADHRHVGLVELKCFHRTDNLSRRCL